MVFEFTRLDTKLVEIIGKARGYFQPFAKEEHGVVQGRSSTTDSSKIFTPIA